MEAIAQQFSKFVTDCLDGGLHFITTCLDGANFITVGLDGNVHLGKNTKVVGIVLSKGALTEDQLNTLRTDLGNHHRNSLEPLESRCHFNNSLHIQDDDLETLKLICDHPHKYVRVAHLIDFLIFRQNGVYVPTELTKISLTVMSSYWNMQSRNETVPFAPYVKPKTRSITSLCLDSPNENPYVLVNFWALLEKAPETKEIQYTTFKWFVSMTSGQQETLYLGEPSHIRRILEADWDFSNPGYLELHGKRVQEENLPIEKTTLRARYKKEDDCTLLPNHVLTAEEAAELQEILDRSSFRIPNKYYYLSKVFVTKFLYCYLTLGGKKFEELLQQLAEEDPNEELVQLVF
jgi:hypothetical protein